MKKGISIMEHMWFPWRGTGAGRGPEHMSIPMGGYG